MRNCAVGDCSLRSRCLSYFTDVIFEQRAASDPFRSPNCGLSICPDMLIKRRCSCLAARNESIGPNESIAFAANFRSSRATANRQELVKHSNPRKRARRPPTPSSPLFSDKFRGAARLSGCRSCGTCGWRPSRLLCPPLQGAQTIDDVRAFLTQRQLSTHRDRRGSSCGQKKAP